MSEREPREEPWTPDAARRIDLAISRVLGLGIRVSVCLLAVGTLIYLWAHYAGTQPETVDALLRSGRAAYHSPAEVASGLVTGNPLALQYLGLGVLMLLPLVPVLLSLYGFLVQHDRAFTIITVFVLGVLSFSFLLSVL